MNQRTFRPAGLCATFLLAAGLLPGLAVAQCPTCEANHRGPTVHDGETFHAGEIIYDGDVMYDGGPVCDEGAADGCYGGEPCQGDARQGQQRHDGHWARYFRKKCGDSGGDGKHCGRPAPPYPVPFATPRPTVPTYYTYPPLMPHHSLPHYRNVYSYHHASGLSRTNVNWHPSYAGAAFKKLHHLFELPR